MAMTKTPVALSVLAAFGAASVEAAKIPVVLNLVIEEQMGGTAQGYLTADTATWEYDTVTQRVAQTGGTHQTRYFFSGTTPIYDHVITGFTIGGGLDAAATSFSCVEGTFGSGLNASICGRYNFGSNFNNESTATWGPGMAFDRTIGGDDAVLGSQFNLSVFDGMTSSFNGTTLIVSNAVPGTLSYTYEFKTAVPLPASLWLFGSALGLMGWLRRRSFAAGVD